MIFRIGGQGKYLKKYQKLVRDLKVSQYIKWLGFLTQEEVVREFNKSMAFILPSHHESFGLVFLESLACGNPVIATSCGGPEDFIRKNNGLLVEIGNIEMISDSIIKMKKNIKNYDSKKIRSDVLKKYSSKVVSQKLVKLYKSIA